MLCGVTATLGSNPSATATAARPHWGRAVLLCLSGVPCCCVAVWPHGCSGRLAGQGCPVCPAGPGCLMCPWAAARPRAVRAASFARRVASKPGQAPPPPTGTAVRPLCHPAISHAIPLSVFQVLKSNRWYSAVFERASIRVVGELHAKFVWGWVMPPPTGTAARPSGPPLPRALHTCGARSLMGSALEGLRLRARNSSPCVAVRS